MPTDLFLEKDMLINVKMKTSEIIKKTLDSKCFYKLSLYPDRN